MVEKNYISELLRFVVTILFDLRKCCSAFSGFDLMGSD